MNLHTQNWKGIIHILNITDHMVQTKEPRLKGKFPPPPLVSFYPSLKVINVACSPSFQGQPIHVQAIPNFFPFITIASVSYIVFLTCSFQITQLESCFVYVHKSILTFFFYRSWWSSTVALNYSSKYGRWSAQSLRHSNQHSVAAVGQMPWIF